MTNNDEKRAVVLTRLHTVFRRVFNIDDLELLESTSASDIPAWDSLMHITLCIAIEDEFQIRLNPSEIANFANIGKMLDLLVEKA